jgi:hypothetical protein
VPAVHTSVRRSPAPTGNVRRLSDPVKRPNRVAADAGAGEIVPPERAHEVPTELRKRAAATADGGAGG